MTNEEYRRQWKKLFKRMADVEFDDDEWAKVFGDKTIEQVIWDFISTALDEVREEAVKQLLLDMRQRMYEWHGTGVAMVDDYKKYLASKESDNNPKTVYVGEVQCPKNPQHHRFEHDDGREKCIYCGKDRHE